MADERYTPADRDEYARFIEKGHVLQLDEDGSVDYFAMDSGFHNGPQCVECGEMWCQHCVFDGQGVDPCVGSGQRLAREASAKANRDHLDAALKAYDNPKALKKRLAELAKDQP